MTRRWSWRVAATVSLGFGSAVARAQAPSATTHRDDTFVGSARVGLTVLYTKPHNAALVTEFVVAPFVNEHWQVGVAPAFEMAGTGGGTHFYTGALEATVNYLPSDGAGDISRPYLGLFAMEAGQSYVPGYGAIGAQVGWLHFLSPSVAFRAEARVRRYFLQPNPLNIADVLVTFDPYLFGRATRRLTTIPNFGVFDASLLADFAFQPEHTLLLDGALAPFLTSWFQIGASANFNFDFHINSSTRAFEGFSRGYLPLDPRLAPFADLFIADQSQGFDSGTLASRGARLGLRTYLTPAVALDLALQWRNVDADHTGTTVLRRREERTLRATLMTQFRAKLGRD